MWTEVIPTPNLLWGSSLPMHRSLGDTQGYWLSQLLSHVSGIFPPSLHSSYADLLLLLYKHQMLSNLKLCTPVLCVGGPSCPCFLWPIPTHPSGISFNVTFAVKSSMTPRLCQVPPFSALTGTIFVLYRAYHTCI